MELMNLHTLHITNNAQPNEAFATKSLKIEGFYFWEDFWEEKETSNYRKSNKVYNRQEYHEKQNHNSSKKRKV